MTVENQAVLPNWATDLLVCPQCRHSLELDRDKIQCDCCGGIGVVESGVLRFGVDSADDAIAWYTSKGGSDFRGRMQIPFTMSSLDAPVYHGFLEELKPQDVNNVIVDIGAADGRNTEPLLGWGSRRVIATDVSLASLLRLRRQMSEAYSKLGQQLLLIECDARKLPLADACADLVIATEVLCCLNEDYDQGLAECSRILKKGTEGRLLISERSWEGGLVSRLLFDGVAGMSQMHGSREILDGEASERLRSRVFTEEELVEQLQLANLTILERKGTSLLSLIMGYLRSNGGISAEDEKYLPQVHELLKNLGEAGQVRRTHTFVASKAA